MKKLDIIFENKEILIVNKPTKQLTISDGKTLNTLYSEARDYVKKQHKSNKIFIVHRLDKDTSGVVLFAKNERIKKYLQDHWNEITTRKYIGIVEGDIKDNKGIIKEYLKETRTHLVYTDKTGNYAETIYQVLNKFKNTTILDIEIKTGRKNQIRVAFQNIGHPIVGDKKYGSNTNPLKRLGLHAYYLKINIDNQFYEFTAKIPEEFKPYLK